MSTVKEIQAAIPKLSREEIEEIREWIDDYLEDHLELTNEVKAKLGQSRREIAAGEYMTRQPNRSWPPRSAIASKGAIFVPAR